MAATKKAVKRSSRQGSPENPKNDYIELRIPRFTLTRIPLFLVLLLVIGAFLLGMLGPRLLQSQQNGPSTNTPPPADLASAFVGYAKQVGIDTKKFQECYASNKFQKAVDEDANAAIQAGVNATPTFFVNGQPIVGALPFEVFKATIEHELTGAPLPTLAPGAPTPLPIQDVALGDLPIQGNKDAAVTIVEFSDFQCPFCEQFFRTTYPQLKKEYIDTGKIAFAYRHFPLTNIHPLAIPAAMASECANEQGKFWEYHDLLFQNQSTWSTLSLTAPTQ